MALNDAHHVVGLRHELGNVFINDFAIVVFCHLLGLHHAAAHGGHLRTVVGVDNRGHDVAAESGADLNEISILIHIKNSAVCCQTGVHTCCNTGSQLSAHCGCTDQNSRRFLFFDKIFKYGGIGLDHKTGQLFIIVNKYFVHTVMKQFLALSFQMTADKQRINRMIDFCSQFPSLADEFHGHRMNLPIHVIHIYGDSVPQTLVDLRLFIFHIGYRTFGSFFHTELAGLAGCIDFQFSVFFFHGAKGTDVHKSLYILDLTLINY